MASMIYPTQLLNFCLHISSVKRNMKEGLAKKEKKKKCLPLKHFLNFILNSSDYISLPRTWLHGYLHLGRRVTLQRKSVHLGIRKWDYLAQISYNLKTLRKQVAGMVCRSRMLLESNSLPAELVHIQSGQKIIRLGALKYLINDHI